MGVEKRVYLAFLFCGKIKRSSGIHATQVFRTTTTDNNIIIQNYVTHSVETTQNMKALDELSTVRDEWMRHTRRLTRGTGAEVGENFGCLLPVAIFHEEPTITRDCALFGR